MALNAYWQSGQSVCSPLNSISGELFNAGSGHLKHFKIGIYSLLASLAALLLLLFIIYPPVTAERQTLIIGRFVHFSLQ